MSTLRTLTTAKTSQCLKSWAVAVAATLATTSVAVAQAAPAPKPALKPLKSCAPKLCTTSFGQSVPIGQGSVQGYAITSGGDRGPALKEMGVLITAAALKGLPQNCSTDKPSPQAKWLICQPPTAQSQGRGQMNDTMVTTLKMPAVAASLANVANLDLSWLPYGHAPEKVWDKPQFDIHFPFVAPNGGQSDQAFYAPKTSADQLPPGYMVLPGSGFHWDTEALQGHSHAADPATSPEFAGGPFLGNFLYLNYDGRAIGYEVYASQALLTSKQTYTKDLPTPQVSFGTSIVPTQMTIRYEPLLSLYRVALTGFKPVAKAAAAAASHSH